MDMRTGRETIVVGFDQSPESHAAVHWGAAEAKVRGAQLRIVTAWDPRPVTPWNLPDLAAWREQASSDAEAAASSARAAVGGGLDVEAVAIEGTAGRVLVDQSQFADLLVIGSAGHVGLAGLMAGSVSRHCLHRAACPLIVLGPKARADQTSRLVLSSTLDPDRETYDWVGAWVQRRALPIYVIASIDRTASPADLTVSPRYRDVWAAAEAENEQWIASLQRLVDVRASIPVEITGAVIEGPSASVLEWHTEPGDLLVVPAGSEHYVPVASGPCPIAVVPPPRREPATRPGAEQGIVTGVTVS
jgi:nucleotide-binding universal stress UspA family protein